MIAHIAFSPCAIEELSTLGPAAVTRSLNRILRDTLAAHGSLHLANDDEKAKLQALIKSGSSLPQREIIAWKEAVLALVSQNRLKVERPSMAHGLSDISSEGELNAVADLHPEIPVLVLTEEQLDKLFPERSDADDTASRYVSGVSIREAEPIARMATRAKKGNLPLGAPRDTFWQDVLAPLAEPVKNITVLDRYIFRGMQSWSDKLPNSHWWDRDVLTWLLDSIAESNGLEVEVDILAGVNQPGLPDSAADALALLRSSWIPPSNCRIRAVNLYVGEWEGANGWLPHDRHIRFGASSIIGVPQGLDRLGRQQVRDQDGMNWNYKWDSIQIKSFLDAETRVRAAHSKLTSHPNLGSP